MQTLSGVIERFNVLACRWMVTMTMTMDGMEFEGKAQE